MSYLLKESRVQRLERVKIEVEMVKTGLEQDCLEAVHCYMHLAILLSLTSWHVMHGCSTYPLNRLACAFRHDFVQVLLVVHDLFGLDLNVHSLATGSSQRLVNHDSGIGHAVALALFASCQQEGSHGSCQAKAVS